MQWKIKNDRLEKEIKCDCWTKNCLVSLYIFPESGQLRIFNAKTEKELDFFLTKKTCTELIDALRAMRKGYKYDLSEKIKK